MKQFLAMIFAGIFFTGCSKEALKQAAGSKAGEDTKFINQTGQNSGSRIAQAEPGTTSLFGYDVAIDNNYSVAGDPSYSELFLQRRGCAYIYTRPVSGTTWTQQARIKNAHGKTDDNFGFKVAIDGNTAVSCTNDSVYVFKRVLGNFWIQDAAFVPNNLPADGLSVSSLDIDGDYIIVGHASRWVNNQPSVGAVYFFKEINGRWTQQASFLSPNNYEYDWFGSDVSIYGNYALVGSRGGHLPQGGGNPGGGNHGGKVYGYIRLGETWIAQATITSSDVVFGDEFGSHVDFRGSYAIIGAQYQQINGVSKGSAYVYKRDGSAWVKQARIVAPDGIAYGDFGKSVSINNTHAVIGGGGTGDAWRGGIYIFSRLGTAWNFLSKDESPNPDKNDFGYCIAMDSVKHYLAGGQHYPGIVTFGTAY